MSDVGFGASGERVKGTIAFEGEAPFFVASSARRRAAERDGIIEVIFYVAAPAQGPEPVPVQIDMAGAVADQVGTFLNAARFRN
jgi:hypothetical protein